MFEVIIQETMTVSILIAISLSTRFLLVNIGQTWVSTFAHTATLLVLPIITFVITKVISGNIALSLGMVGALSIIRFRNPVRSPFELSIYFASITMGIAASVNLKWLIFFVGSLALALLTAVVVSFVFNKITGKQFFETSFSEGNRNSTLEVSASGSLPELQENSYLISESKSDGQCKYILASANFEHLQHCVRNIENNSSILTMRLTK